MHQCLIQWIEGSVEIVKADSSFSIAAADAQYWNFEQSTCISGIALDTEFLKMSDFELQSIQAVGPEELS